MNLSDSKAPESTPKTLEERVEKLERTAQQEREDFERLFFPAEQEENK